jgi:hypothetical protein
MAELGNLRKWRSDNTGARLSAPQSAIGRGKIAARAAGHFAKVRGGVLQEGGARNVKNAVAARSRDKGGVIVRRDGWRRNAKRRCSAKLYPVSRPAGLC